MLAIDIDPDAVKVAKRMWPSTAWQAVKVVGRIWSAENGLQLAVANIVADAIRMLASPLTRHLLPGGC